MALDLRSSELQYSFLKERISNVDKHFSEISLKLAAYLKKQSQVRDSGDDLALSISSFAVTENLNFSLRKCLIQFADILKAVQEYRDAQIWRTDAKVVFEFANYKPICKGVKSELKTNFDLRAKEQSMKNKLEKTRGKNPTNLQKIAQAEKEAYQAQVEATRTTVELSKRIDDFEQQKLQKIKHTLLKFINIEMVFHAKAIELYTTAYNSIKNITVEEDLKEFRSHVRSYATPFDSDNTLQADDQTNISNSKGAHSNSDTSETVGHLTKSNTGFKASLESRPCSTSQVPPNTTPSKSFQGAQKNDTLNRSNHPALENVSLGFGSWLGT